MKPSINFIVVIMTVSGVCDIMSVSHVYIPNCEMPECDIKSVSTVYIPNYEMPKMKLNTFGANS